MPSAIHQLITPPAAGRLLRRSHVWAWQAAKAGKFGPTQKRGRVTYIAIDELERRFGTTFSEEQIKIAISDSKTRVAIGERDAQWCAFIRRKFGYTANPPNPLEED
jgi:hypothetical protein